MKNTQLSTSLLFTVLTSGICSAALPDPRTLPTAESWLESETQVAMAKIQNAMSQPGNAPGVVIASPSTANPNYYFYWVRDGALTMNVVADLAEVDSANTSYWQNKLNDYVEFSRQNQTSNTLTGLGEPKFNVDGSPFDLPWGRPQNDGPASRAIALVHYAQFLLNQGNFTYVQTKLYDGKSPSNSVIKADLDYVATNWQNPCFDLWEETKGDHFYTRMVQRKALTVGAALAQKLGDQASSDYYLRQAQAIQASLTQFWSPNDGYIVATLNFQAATSKSSDLDVAVILAALHGGMNDGVFDFNDSRIRSTANALVSRFSSLYPINNVAGFPAVAIGRYPEDMYNGGNNTGGNPWVLATLALAESYYDTALSLQQSGDQSDVASLIAGGDLLVQRVALHANPDGSLSEQIDRNNGYMTSANNLTWNYAAILTTYWARKAVAQ